MNQKNLAKYLQVVTLGLVLLVAIVYIGAVPGLMSVLLECGAILHKSGVKPWIIMVWVTAIPVYFSLYHFWKISKEIQADNSFSTENAKHLQTISHLCMLDVLYFFVANIVFYLLHINGIITLCCTFAIDFIGIVISVLAAALSHLVYKAAAMKQENDLTI